MTPLSWIITSLLAMALLSSSRRWAPAFLLAGCILLTPTQSIVIGGLRFPVLRILILAGILRVMARGERSGTVNTRLDKLVGWWLFWLVFISLFQPYEDGSGPVYAVGTALNVGGVYYLFRIWNSDLKDTKVMLAALALLLVPLALEMAYEQMTGMNIFGKLGGVNEYSTVRDGRIRSSGSFRHPILAGTVGAVCFPLMVALYRERRMIGIIGMLSSVAIVVTSRSSGPLMSLFFAIGFLLLWRLRRHYVLLFRLSILAYFLLELVMSKPAYYLMARIDLSGGSTGYHRVYLLDAFFRYFSEWWLIGTTYTRHWMMFGVSYSENHADITSYYIANGVNSGLMGLILLLMVLFSAIHTAPRYARTRQFVSAPDTFFVWCLGSGMAAHAATSLSVSYFDQSICFFWMNIALLGTAQTTLSLSQTESAGAET